MSGNGSLATPWDIVTGLGLTVGNEIQNSISSTRIMYLRGGTYDGDFSCYLTGRSGNNILIQPYTGESPLIDGSLNVGREWVTLKDLHIKDTDFTDRYSEAELGGDLTSLDGLSVSASNVILQDCIIENCLQGIMMHSDIENVIMDGCIIYYNGWDAPIRPHGHGIYANSNLATIKNCILFSNSCYGAKIYTGVGNIDDGLMQDNIAFNNNVLWGGDPGNGNLLIGAEGTADDCYRLNMTRNYTYQTEANRAGRQNFFGYQNTFKDGTMVDNYMPDGCDVLTVENYPGLTWLANSGNTFAPEETNRVFTIAVRGRLHVAVYNWELSNTVDIDVSGTFANGVSVEAVNVQDYFTDIQTLTVTAGKVTVNMQAINRSVQTGQGFDAPATTFPEFGCFVIRAA